jgi:glycine betaine/proline transport system ATP-binding protein
VNRAKVLSARSLMTPATAKAKTYDRVEATARIASFAAAIVDSPKPFAVIGEKGDIIGEISPRAVIDLLSGKERSVSA